MANAGEALAIGRKLGHVAAVDREVLAAIAAFAMSDVEARAACSVELIVGKGLAVGEPEGVTAVPGRRHGLERTAARVAAGPEVADGVGRAGNPGAQIPRNIANDEQQGLAIGAPGWPPFMGSEEAIGGAVEELWAAALDRTGPDLVVLDVEDLRVAEPGRLIAAGQDTRAAALLLDHD
jgi:hypothetical protein